MAKFLASRGFVESQSLMSIYMEGPGIDDRDRLHLLCMFAYYLKDENRTPKDHFQALAGEFSSFHHPIWIFTDPIVMLARSTTCRWQGRDLSLASEQAQKSPVTFSMLSEMYHRVWPYTQLNEPTDTQKDEVMAFFAGLSMYNWGLRISETSKVLPDKEFFRASKEWGQNLDSHAVKAEDFMFGFPYRKTAAESTPLGLDWLSAYECSISSDQEINFQGIPSAVGVSIRTSKTNQYGKRDVRYMVSRESEGEGWLIDGLYLLALAAGYHTPRDMFFSRVAAIGQFVNNRKRLTTKMVATLVKDCAFRMNLPPNKFSTKSFKSGGISSLKVLGDSQQLLQSKMDHSTASASQHYQCPLLGQHQGPLAGGLQGYSLDAVRIDLQLQGVSSNSVPRTRKVPIKSGFKKVVPK